MIIQCPHCQSRFKLATEKIKPGGTKVRCTKCKSIFIVSPSDKSSGDYSGEAENFDPKDDRAGSYGTSDASDKGSAFTSQDYSAFGENADFFSDDFGRDFDAAEFFNSGDGETEFFLNGEPAESSREPAEEESLSGSDQDEPSALEFGEDLLHDRAGEESAAGAESPPYEVPGARKPLLVLAEEDPPAVDFAGHSGPEAGSRKVLQLPLDPAPPPAAVQRKRASKGLVLLLVMALALLGVLGYQYSQGRLAGLSVYLRQLQGRPEVPVVAGKLVPLELSGYYVENKLEGRLFVVQGQVVNEFTEARASIAVVGLVYDRQGAVIARQAAYCGSPMRKSQLRSQPFARMEERMNNEFGEALANINVEPKKAIPFTIVFRDLPAEVAEFGVQVVDSKPVGR
jgi:predicted Zn finger-like uncharacterized protein